MRAGIRASDAVRGLLPAVLWLSATASLVAGSAAQSAQPPEVAGVEVRLAGRSTEAEDLRPLIAIRPGAPLDAADIRRTLRSFHASGLFSRVEVMTRDAPDAAGVIVVLVAEKPPVIGRVRIGGETGISAGRLRRLIRQQDRATLARGRMDQAVQSILETLHKKGYFEAEARWALRAATDRSGAPRADVVVEVRAGPRAIFGAQTFSGDLGPHGAEDLRPPLRLRQKYDPERLEESVERLRRFLVERGHLSATIEPPDITYDAERQVVDVRYRVDAGPLYEVETQGVERRWLERRGFLPLRERPFEAVLFEQGCARLEDHLQARGHFRAEVECRIDQPAESLAGIEAPDRKIFVEVEEGPVFEVDSISFSGNEHIQATELEPLVRLGPRRMLRPGSGRLVSRELEVDLENLRSYYLLKGFLDATVLPARVSEPAPGKLAVEIKIEEGKQRRVVALEAAGVTVWEPRDLLAKLPLEPGGGFHPLRLEDSLNAIRTLYGEEGYASAVVQATLDWSHDKTLVDVRFEIDEGPKRTLDRLVLRGLQHTRPILVDAYAGLETGDVISRRRLLEAERELYRLGIFSQVDVGLVPSTVDDARRNVSIRLEEGRRWRLSYGVSYHSDDGIGGLVGLSRANLRGLGERLQLDLRASENDQRLRLFYDQPIPFGVRLPLTWTLFLRHEDRQSFQVDESGFRVSMFRELSDLRLGLLYDYRLVELAGELFDPSLLDREDREVEISSLAPNILLDRRDDPLEPSRGWSLAAQLEYAFPFARAEADFFKLFAQHTRYADLWGFGTLAASLRFGLIEPLGGAPVIDPILPPELESSRVPISERFFAGGRTSHRAFERDSLGILGQSLIERDGGGLVEVGGNGLLLLNLDWRFPISGPVGGVAFLDLGNVWSDWQDLDLEDLRPGFGLGVRYASPVGPVRLEIGWKLDTQDFEDDAPVFLLSFGNPF